MNVPEFQICSYHCRGKKFPEFPNVWGLTQEKVAAASVKARRMNDSLDGKSSAKDRMTRKDLRLVAYAMKGFDWRSQSYEDVRAACFLALVEAHRTDKRGIDLLRAVQHARRTEERRQWNNENRTAFPPLERVLDPDQDDYADQWNRIDFDLQASDVRDDPDWTKVRDAISHLPARQQQALMLVYFRKMTEKQAAETMRISQSAVAALLDKAKKNFQTIFSVISKT